MTVLCERRLRERLDRVRALQHGATTAGEREAARRAAARLVERLVDLGVDPAPRPPLERWGPPTIPSAPMPSSRAVRAALARWQRGEWSDRRVRHWAARHVDRVWLPEEHDHADACCAEVLLSLAGLHRTRLCPADVPAILSFLDAGDWGAWFALLARAAGRAARRPERRRAG
jgi:hypothetical protein